MRKAEYLAGYICPICEKPTVEPAWKGILSKNSSQWQCHNCGAWHNEGVGERRYDGDPILAEELICPDPGPRDDRESFHSWEEYT